MSIDEVLKKAMSNNVPDGHCYQCGNQITGGTKRQKFCNGICKYDFSKYNVKKTKYRSHKYMYIYLGYGVSKGMQQGKRVGGMVTGSMSASCAQWSSPVPVTLSNIKESLTLCPDGINLCTNVWLTKEEAIELANYFVEIGEQFK